MYALLSFFLDVSFSAFLVINVFFMQATLHLILTFQEFFWFEFIMENIIVLIQICPEFKALLHQSAASLGVDKDCG